MIRVASFNVKQLSMKSQDEESLKKRDIDKMAYLISKYDIVALQEVLTPAIVETTSHASQKASLTRRLGIHWQGKWVYTEPGLRNNVFLGVDRRHEGLAFLWNTQIVELLEDDRDVFLTKKYKAIDGISLRREPGYARFKIKNRPVEIRVINVHIISEKPDSKNVKPGIDLGSKQKMRMREFEIIAGQIYKNINDCKLHKETTVAYTIIIGDYNLNLEGHGTDSESMPQMCYFNSMGQRCFGGPLQIKTIQEERTTLKKDGSGFRNNFDHCSFNVDCNGHVIKNCYRTPYLNDKTTEEIKEFHDTVSDHVPIVVEINC